MKKFSSTTRGSSRHTSQTKKRIGASVMVGLVGVLLIWLIPQFLAGVTAIVVTPIQATKTWLSESTNNLPTYLRDRKELVAITAELKEKLALQSGTEYSLELLIKENKELRTLLGDEGEEGLLAAIIGRPNELPYDVLVINRGAKHGVVVDAPVYIGENRVVGLVSKVFSESSVVELVTTPGFSTSVFVVGPDIYTTAVGIGGGQLRIGVPQGIDLAEGNPVILPAVSTAVYGVINHIESLPTQPEQYGFVSTDVPIQSLRYVAVGSAPITQISFEEAQGIVSEGLSALFSVPVPDDILVVPDGATSSPTSTLESATSSNDDDSL